VSFIKVSFELTKATLVLLVLTLGVGYLLGNVFGISSFTGNTVGTSQQQIQPPTVQQNPTQPSRIQLSTDGEPSLGKSDAKVLIVEFTDYQCPFCKRAHDQTFPLIKRDYIDTGKVRYVAKDFPLSFHVNADEASEASNCVLEQSNDKYWEFADIIFDKQDEWSSSSDPFTIFKGYAKDLGLNSAKFDSCVDSAKYRDEVNDDLQEGTLAGVSGTPSFYINGVNIVGAQPYSVFQQAIEAEL